MIMTLLQILQINDTDIAPKGYDKQYYIANIKRLTSYIKAEMLNSYL